MTNERPKPGRKPGSNEVLGLCAPLIHFQILIWIAWNDPRYTTRPRRRRLNDVESVVFFFVVVPTGSGVSSRTTDGNMETNDSVNPFYYYVHMCVCYT